MHVKANLRRAIVAAAATGVVAVGLAVSATPAGAAGHPDHNAGCVAQIVDQYGAPGVQVEAIKQSSAAPGQFISSVAHQPNDTCRLG